VRREGTLWYWYDFVELSPLFTLYVDVLPIQAPRAPVDARVV
jgi:hypothetical protein